MSAEPCGDPCPRQGVEGVTCSLKAGSNHQYHTGRVPGGGWIEWSNTSYEKPVPKKKWEPRPPRAHQVSEYVEAVNAAAEHRKAEDEAERRQITPTPPEDLHRSDDPSTSVRAAMHASVRSGSKKALLLAAYAVAENGLTDEEAAIAAGLSLETRGWHQRSSDLRTSGLITPTTMTRVSPITGLERMVCCITTGGLAALRGDTPPTHPDTPEVPVIP